ncbi:MAG: hypothetical protein ACK6C0_11555, partial [Betaproteobacteria bacterium]
MTDGPQLLRLHVHLRGTTLSVLLPPLLAALAAAGLPAPLRVRPDDGAERPFAASDPALAQATLLAFAFAQEADTADLYPAPGAGRSIFSLELDAEARDAPALRALLHALADFCCRLADAGLLERAGLRRHRGGHCLPQPPLAASGTHLVALPLAEIAAVYGDQATFRAAWDSAYEAGGVCVLQRALDAPGNPDFLRHVLPGQMAMVRAAPPARLEFAQPLFATGEFELLDAAPPTLNGVGYFADEQVYEFAGHLPPGADLRPLDLLLVWRIKTQGQVTEQDLVHPVRTVRVVFDHEAAARRAAPLLGAAGAEVCWIDAVGA